MKSFIYIIIALGVFLTGCIKTEGVLNISGKVIDEYSKVQIPGREIIVQGLLDRNYELATIDVGHFSTDSSGCFMYTLTKVKNVRYYNFCLVGDSNYASMTKKVGLFELKENAKYLFFSLSKLVDLTIKIEKISKTPYRDTLYLSWESDNVDFKTLYPYKVDNFGIADNSFALMPSLGLRWIGGNIDSKIHTRVYADKMTKIHWEMVRNKKRLEFIDTITCKRDLVHNVYFSY